MKCEIGPSSSRIKEFTLLGIQPTCQCTTNMDLTDSRNEKAAWRGATDKEMTHNLVMVEKYRILFDRLPFCFQQSSRF